MSGISGYPFVGKREDHDTNKKTDRKFVTVKQLGHNTHGMDTIAYGTFRHTEDAVVEAGSTDSIVNLTGHLALAGDVLRVKISANGIKDLDFPVKEVTTNTITIEGVASAEFATGDTIDILRPIPHRLDESGASLTTVDSAVKINVKSAGTTTTTDVLDDQDTPANTVPMPVRLYGATGNISITSEELNVQLSHNAASPDSIKVGDGVETLDINAANEAMVHDTDALTELQAILLKIIATPATEAKQDDTITALGVLLTELQAKADLTETQPCSVAGVATELKQDDAITQLTAIAGEDFATQATLAILNGKFGSIGQKANAASAPVTLSSEQETIIDAIKTAVEIIDNAVDGNQMQVDLVDLGGAATEATLALQSAKLPAALGQLTKANSLSVTVASDQEIDTAKLNVLTFAQIKFATSNVLDTGYTQLIADIGAIAGKKVRIFYAGGEPMYLAIGAAASESDKMMVWPGMDAELDLSQVANARLSLKAVNGSTTINSGNLVINILG